MAGASNIEWTDATWNPIVGCSIKSPGCARCYAMPMAARVEAMFAGTGGAPQYDGLTKKVNGKSVFTGKVAQASDEILTQPLRWKKPRKIFVNSMGDLFHESIPDEWIDRVFAVMALSPQHTFQVLTKRADRMRAYFADENLPFRVADAALVVGRHLPDGYRGWSRDYWKPSVIRGCTQPAVWPLPNVWLGVSTERQQEADERIPMLLQTPAAVRFISAEPLLGPVDLGNLRGGTFDALTGCGDRERIGEWQPTPHLDWVIVGGESGPGARPMHPDWARSLRDQCGAAGVPLFFKQWGEWAPICDMDEDAIERCYVPAPETNPDATRRCKVGCHVLHHDGSRHGVIEPGAFAQGAAAMTMFSVGKSRSGRKLQGKEHNAFPEAKEVAFA